MRKSEFIEFRRQELARFYRDALGSRSRSARAESMGVPERTEHRLSIGARIAGGGDFQVVLRVQSESGRAMTRAQKILEELRANGETPDLAVVKAVHTPSRSGFAESNAPTTRPFGARTIRPIEIGYSIGHGEGTPGTITAFIDTPEGVAALSCNHVLALANKADVGQRIYQAGPPDNDANTRFAIGRLGHFTELSRTGANEVDAALCLLDVDNAELGGFENIVPKVARAPDAGERLIRPIDPFDLPVDGKIGKLGRTTGYRSAPINAMAIGVDDVPVFIPGAGNHRFDGLIELEWPTNSQRAFAEPGDSGAVYFLEGERTPFAMHVASGTLERNGVSRAVSYACPLIRVLTLCSAKFR